MKKTLIILFASLVYVQWGFAQGDERTPIYFDKDWKIVPDKANAAYYRTVERQGNSYLVKDFLISGKIQMEAVCSEYEPKLKVDGLKKVYYENGNLKEEGVLDNNRATGIHKVYYWNGQLMTEMNYGEEARYVHYYDSAGTELLKNGEAIVFQSPGRERFQPNGRFPWYLDIKNYASLGTFYIEEEAGDTIYTIAEHPVEYRGGHSQLSRELSAEIKYPPKAKKREVSGRIFIGFIIDKAGKMRDVKVVKGISTECDEEAVRAVKTLKAWIPATHRSKTVSSRFVLPVVFSLR